MWIILLSVAKVLGKKSGCCLDLLIMIKMGPPILFGPFPIINDKFHYLVIPEKSMWLTADVDFFACQTCHSPSFCRKSRHFVASFPHLRVRQLYKNFWIMPEFVLNRGCSYGCDRYVGTCTHKSSTMSDVRTWSHVNLMSWFSAGGRSATFAFVTKICHEESTIHTPMYGEVVLYTLLTVNAAFYHFHFE